MTAFYNELDPYCAEWLRNLIKEGHIADGIVDERSIEDITPNDLKGFTQCHFFAGIGLWSLALRRAGVSDDTPVWTGSCPCQPFSAAGEGKGFADERHLWPAWNHLIGECRPIRIFGEQVASKDGLGWLDLVSADLEGQGYAVGAKDLCAAGFGAFHIRQRLYFTGVADADDTGSQGRFILRERGGQRIIGAGGVDGHGLAHPTGTGPLPDPHTGVCRGEEGSGSRDVEPQRLGDASFWLEHAARLGWVERGTEPVGRGIVGGCSDGAVWHYCRDGKYRPIPVEPEFFPLANGHTNRVGKLRAYGNAIHVETATGFVRACM